MTRPQHIDLDTPEGLLSLTWPQPQPVFTSDHLEPVACDQQQDPTPLALLNGEEITVERAQEIVRKMAEDAPRN